MISDLLKKKIVLSQEYTLQKIEIKNSQRFYLFNIKSGEIYKLNETAYKFLSLLDGTKTVEQVISLIANFYDINEEIVRKDFHPIVNEWYEKGIVTKANPDERR